MTSPKARRRQRGVRVTAAVVFLVLSAVFVAAALASGLAPLVALSAVVAFLLGAAATRMTYAELRESRFEAAHDRAVQAQNYRDLAETRSAEHAAHAAQLLARIEHGESAVGQLEEALQSAQHRAAEAARRAETQTDRADRAESEVVRLGVRVDESDERAAEAIVRVAELEQEREVRAAELDALQSELSAWQSMHEIPVARHA